MGDHQRRAAELVDGVDDLLLDTGVEQRRRLVEHQDVRFGQPGPGEGDELALRGGEVAAFLLDRVGEATGRTDSSGQAPTARAALSTSSSVASGLA